MFMLVRMRVNYAGKWYVSGALGLSLDTSIGFEVDDSVLWRRGDVDLSGDAPSLRAAIGHWLTENTSVEAALLLMPYDMTDAKYTEVMAVPLEQINATSKLSGDTNVRALMFNVSHKFDLGGRLVPSIGAGVGVSEIDIDGEVELLGKTGSVRGSEYAMAYQVQVGLDYELTENTNLFARLQGLSLGGVEMKQKSGAVIKTDREFTPQIWVGLQYRF